MPDAKSKEDKGLLKKRLYHDQATLIVAVRNAETKEAKEYLQYVLDLVNEYILICVKRNKF